MSIRKRLDGFCSSFFRLSYLLSLVGKMVENVCEQNKLFDDMGKINLEHTFVPVRTFSTVSIDGKSPFRLIWRPMVRFATLFPRQNLM